jgi:hypothetical protein
VGVQSTEQYFCPYRSDTIRTDERRLISAEIHLLGRTAGYTRWDHKINEDILTELQMSQITEFIYQCRKRNWKERVNRMSSDRIPKMILKYQPRRENKFRKTLEKMEGFSFVTPVTRLNAPNTGKQDDE